MPSPQELHPRSRSFGPRFYGSQGLIHYIVATVVIIDFKRKPIMKFVFFGFGEHVLGDEGADEAMPSQNFWARTAPGHIDPELELWIMRG